MKTYDHLTPKELESLEAESQRAWEDKRRDKAIEAMSTYREALRGDGAEINESRDD